jgi:hypothetical protein
MRSVSTAIAVWLALTGAAQALTPEEQGTQIFAERERRNAGWQDYQVALTMVLRNALGEESRRELEIRQLEVPTDGDKLLVVFDTPKAIKGTALLSFGHKVGPDDQWLFLPAMQRVKKIASVNKSGPFLGSEFAFEDLASQKIEKYTYKYIGPDRLDGVACHVIERYPVDPYSGYTRQIVWLDDDELRIRQVHYFDRKDSHLKTLTMTDYKLYLSAYWKAARWSMTNLQTGKSTELLWGDYAFRVGLQDERDFSTNSLKRVN